MSYKPIDAYGIIGDMHSAALVGLDGSIDWCCFPRFDSPSVFAAILDDAKGGRFQVAPSQPYTSTQRYLPDANILETTFTTETGQASLVDFMPLSETRRPGASPHEIYRIVRCDRGRVNLVCLFDPRLGYARAATRLKSVGTGVVAWTSRESITLSAQQDFRIGPDGARTDLFLREGEQTTLVLSYGRKRPLFSVRNRESLERLEWTRQFWEALVASMRYNGLWREEVVRSFLVLHLLMYRPTGAVVAAPTTSLPEEIGGARNWDYRYCWLRDGAWTLGILFRIGDAKEGRAFMRWLLRQVTQSLGRTRIVYGIASESDLRERTLRHLEGYRGSRPVRIGNGAATHLQMDVFGEVIMSIATYQRYGGYISKEIWSIVETFAEAVFRSWQRPDRGIWEVRGRPRHFVYSKVMCWAALDRAVKLAQLCGYPAPVERWQQTAETIRREILKRGWSHRKQAFTQSYDSDVMDASVLILPFVDFLPPEDPRIQSTVQRVIEELAEGPFVRRYRTEEAEDGLPGGEGAFTMLAFWLIGGLIYCGMVDQARQLFEQVLQSANHVGLMSEMIDPRTRQALGNFPQAFSHIGLIHTARNLSRALLALQRESLLAN